MGSTKPVAFLIRFTRSYCSNARTRRGKFGKKRNSNILLIVIVVLVVLALFGHDGTR